MILERMEKKLDGRARQAEAKQPLAETIISPKEKRDLSIQLLDAAFHGDTNKVRRLLAKGADVGTTEKGNSGGTALMLAAIEGNKKVVELLIANGASVDVRDSNRHTPLMRAAREGHLGVVEVLIANGADLSARGSDGRTALLLADNAGIAKLLKQHAE